MGRLRAWLPGARRLPSAEAATSTADEDRREDQRLQVLLVELDSAREDERTFSVILAQVLSVAVAIFAAMAVFVGLDPGASDAVQAIRSSEGLSRLALGLVPLLPLALFAYVSMHGAMATIRQYYIRSLEQAIQQLASARLEVLESTMPVPSLYQLVMTEVSLRRGRPLLRSLVYVAMAATLVLFGVISGVALWMMSDSWWPKVIAGAVYMLLIVSLVTQALRTTVKGREYAKQAVGDYLHGRGDDQSAGRPRGRSLAGYFLLPRPQDVIKFTIIPVSVLVAAVATTDPSAQSLAEHLQTQFHDRWPGFLAVWVTFEYLLYQARYQLNDIRGFEEDQRTPGKGRLPGPLSKADTRFKQSVAVILVRLALACVVVVALPEYRLVLVAGLVLLGLQTLVYEPLRSWESTLVERKPRQPAKEAAAARSAWFLVGMGYAMRGAIGAYLVREGVDVIFWVLVGVLWVFGMAFVTQTWALQALGEAKQDIPPFPKAGPPESALRDVYPRKRLLLRGIDWEPVRELVDREFAGLRRRAGRWEQDARFSAPVPKLDQPTYVHWPVLSPRPRGALWGIVAPWNVAYLLASAGAGALAALLIGVRGTDAIVAGCAAGIVAIVVCVSHRWWRALAALLVLISVPALEYLALGIDPGGTLSWAWLLASLLPLAIVNVVFVMFGASSWYQLSHPSMLPRAVMVWIAVVLTRGLSGPTTWRRIRPTIPDPNATPAAEVG